MRMYLDTSALVKIVKSEPESFLLVRSLEEATVKYTSIIGRIELERGIRRAFGELDDASTALLRELTFLPVDAAVSDLAARVSPPTLKSLDAIHLATLLHVRGDIDEFYCYSDQLSRAARTHGIEVSAPG